MCFSRGLKVHELQLWGQFNRNISLKLLNMGLCKRSQFIRVRGPQSKKLRGMPLRSEANSRIRNGWPEVRHGLGQGNKLECAQHENPQRMCKGTHERMSLPKNMVPFPDSQVRTFLPLHLSFLPPHVWSWKVKRQQLLNEGERKRKWGKERSNSSYFIPEGRWPICCLSWRAVGRVLVVNEVWRVN